MDVCWRGSGQAGEGLRKDETVCEVDSVRRRDLTVVGLLKMVGKSLDGS